MARIINRLSRGDAGQKAVLSRSDAVEVKFYHMVTELYHHMTLKIVRSQNSELIMNSVSKGDQNEQRQIDIRIQHNC
jgi:hypothetical protein